MTAEAEPRQNGPSILIEIINVTAPATRMVDAEQASARFGVSRQTLYSYVSRGLIRAVPVPDDTRRSLYDARDIAGLIEKRSRPSVPMMMRHRPPGSLALRVLKDDPAHAHASNTD